MSRLLSHFSKFLLCCWCSCYRRFAKRCL